MLAAFAVAALLSFSTPPTVSTDSPDHANGTFTVAPGAWQAELGVDVTLPGSGTIERDQPVHIPSTIRVGLTDRIELRAFDGEPLIISDPNRRVGEDTAFGLKIRFNDLVLGTRRPSFGVETYVATSTVRLLHDLESLAIGGTLLWAQPLARWLILDANVGLELGVGDPSTPVAGFTAISAQITASARWIPYAEIYVELPTHAPETIDVGTDAGLIVVASRRVALDVAGRVTLLAEGPDYGVIAGLAVLLADGTRWRRWIDRRRG